MVKFHFQTNRTEGETDDFDRQRKKADSQLCAARATLGNLSHDSHLKQHWRVGHEI